MKDCGLLLIKLLFLTTSKYLQGFRERTQEYFEKKLKEFWKNSRILAKKLNEPVVGRYT